ncbi:hypothetical protein [Streptomyces lanatus]|uniref:Uncharacterized protein n=1 Tax=Streptomyces lanatus TaxID=66900 RepID=A0ABV1Y0K7_9ACTN|nr:hypothetical protein [Streptomyces lanatus]GHH22283.1 hypothetical protein GCM10018780_70580 [Streptomyces lanatus]
MPKAGITYGPRIQAPDYAQIDETAEQEVLKGLGLQRPEDLVAARPDGLVVKAWGIVEQADAELGAYLDERDRALAHLWFYEPRLGLARTAGLSTMGYRGAIARVVYGDKKHPLPEVQSNEALAKLGKELRVKQIKDAEAKLLEVAPIVYAARARRELAVRFMQEAVLALSQEPYGWTPDQIAEHVGVHRDLIYKQRAAARKRHGL